MNEEGFVKYISKTFPDVEATTGSGYTFFFYGSDHRLPFATLASSDNDYERVSNLDRPGVFRLNIGVSKQTYQSLFGMNEIDATNYDFTILDRIMPHPHYAPQYFVCILNPSETTLTKAHEMLAEAYQLAMKRKKKTPSRGQGHVA